MKATIQTSSSVIAYKNSFLFIFIVTVA